MPFTGTGTGIQNANDVFFSGLSTGNVLQFNGSTAKWNNIALNLSTAQIADGAITEPKLAISNSPSANNILSWNGSALAWVAPASGGGGGNTYTSSDAARPGAASGMTWISTSSTQPTGMLAGDVWLGPLM